MLGPAGMFYKPGKRWVCRLGVDAQGTAAQTESRPWIHRVTHACESIAWVEAAFPFGKCHDSGQEPHSHTRCRQPHHARRLEQNGAGDIQRRLSFTLAESAGDGRTHLTSLCPHRLSLLRHRCLDARQEAGQLDSCGSVSVRRCSWSAGSFSISSPLPTKPRRKRRR
jgi:hypothetical protein